MNKRSLSLFLVSLVSGVVMGKAPSILWIVTDDQRPDSVSAFNQAVYGQKDSPLGYVESPHTDKLASEGVLFTNANCNSPACGPSRGSMFTGRYPFRNGHYAFEQTHQSPDFVTPMVQRTMKKKGYATASFGKEDHYVYEWGPGQGFYRVGDFDHWIHFKGDLQKNDLGDLFTANVYGEHNGVSGVIGNSETLIYPDGRKKSYFIKKFHEELSAEDIAMRKEVDREFDLLRSYTRFNPLLIIGGENPKPAGETVDAYIVKEMVNYLENADSSYKTLWGRKATGAPSKKPVFLQLGFHLPHTPVLPPKSFRDRFKTKTYKVPDFDKEELEKLPPQLKSLYKAMKIDGLTDAEKQTAIQDYYAFCAYGDSLIGEAVESFKKYCKKHDQEYLILFTVGDHGWHLGEQGIEAKFGPWKQSVGNAAILVSSDKSKAPAGKVHRDFVEFVDFAPTFIQAAGGNLDASTYDYLDGYSLFDVLEEKKPKREYVLGEMNLVIGHRAYLHSDRFRFSMRTRPFGSAVLSPENIGKKMKWALEAPLEDVDIALYDLKRDPLERNNVAYSKEYRELSEWLRNKLGRIVLGDGRVECDWSKENSYVISNFAEGADDKILQIPSELIPRL